MMNKAIALEKGSELEEYMLARAAKKFYSRGDHERFDLFPFYSILVTAGVTNKNLDAFDVVETYRARHSPLDKPVNIGHNQTKIIGHMMDCVAVDDNLKPIPEDTDEGDLPTKLHLVTSSVIYKVWEDPRVQAEVNEIIDKIAKGQIFVSMETLFRDFDFLLTNASTGEKRLLARNDKTSGLTKFLRQYKGPGKLYQYEIARLLKNMTFSAVGIVEKPANEESVISASLDYFSTAENIPEGNVYINLDISRSGDNLQMPKEATVVETAMAVEDAAKYKELLSNHESLVKAHELMRKDNDYMHNHINELKVQLVGAQNSLALAEMEKNNMAKAADEKKEKDDKVNANDGDADDEAMASLKAQVESLTKEVATLTENLATANTAKASVDAEFEKTKADNDAMRATIDAYKKASRHSDRAEALMSADATLTREKALEKVSAMDEMADATFASMCEMIKGYASRAPKEVTPESILAGAKAEASPPLGASPENSFEKTSADIKKFLTSKKGA